MQAILIILMLLMSPSFPVDEGTYVNQSFRHLGHVGVDLNVGVGTPVHAVLDGVVVEAFEDSRVYGRTVMILHNNDGYMSLYAHLSKLMVHKGDLVYGGQVIGLSGGDPKDNIDGDGQSSGAHLHFEVRVPGHLDNNLYNVNPLEYIRSYMLCASGMRVCY